MNAALRGGDGDAERLGDFLVRKSLDVAQHDCGAMLKGERFELPYEQALQPGLRIGSGRDG
jgi:hypothetical protein